MSDQTIKPVIYTTSPDEAGRIRLSQAILDAVSWLRDLKSSAPVDCVVRLGSQRQLVFTPASPADESPLPTEDASAVLEAAARYLASRWEVRLSAEPNKRRREFTVPRELRLLKVASGPTEPAVIFAYGDQLELWLGEAWVAHIVEMEKRRDAKRQQLTSES